MYELAKQIVCSIIAVALGTTVAIVRGLLPLNPQWLERVAHLAAHFKAIGQGQPPPKNGLTNGHHTTTNGHSDNGHAAPSAAATGPAEKPAAPNEDLKKILVAYQQLWDFVQSLKTKGLALDDEFCETIEREWSVSTLLSYMRSADKTLQDSASEVQASAARHLMPGGQSGEGQA